MREKMKEIKSIYLKNKNIETGDILLTMGSGLNSKFIALSSNSKFSHAALLVKDDDIVSVIESDRNGVYPRNYTLSSGRPLEGSRLEFYTKLPSDVSHAIVLRHRDIGKISKPKIDRALERLEENDLHKRYSKLERLVDISTYPKIAKELIKKTISLTSKSKKNKDYIYGSFCSEVVAIFYSYINLNISSKKQLAHMISPGDISIEKDLLIDVSNLVIDGEIIERKDVYEKSNQLDQISINMIKNKEISNAISNLSLALAIENREGVFKLASYISWVANQIISNNAKKNNLIKKLYGDSDIRISISENKSKGLIIDCEKTLTLIINYLNITKNIEVIDDINVQEVELISKIQIEYTKIKIKYLMILLNENSMIIRIKEKNTMRKERSFRKSRKSIIDNIKLLRKINCFYKKI